MQHIDVNKKRPARWPWLMGVGVLVLVTWGVTVLLRPPAPPEEPDDVITAADTLPPSLIPSDDNQGSAPGQDPDVGPAGSLTEDRIGERIRVEGEVLAIGNDGFWILTDGRVLRVDSPLRARTGDTLSVEGTLREAGPAASDRLAPETIAGHRESDSWTVLRSIKVVDDDASATTAPPGSGG